MGTREGKNNKPFLKEKQKGNIFTHIRDHSK